LQRAQHGFDALKLPGESVALSQESRMAAKQGVVGFARLGCRIFHRAAPYRLGHEVIGLA
jgi:hypothetical protein